MSLRRVVRKRAVVIVCAVLLLPVGYVLGCPWVILFGQKYARWSRPIVVTLYTPLEHYVRSELPGSRLFLEYAHGCQDLFNEYTS